MNRRDLEVTHQDLDFAVGAIMRPGVLKNKRDQSKEFKRWEAALRSVNDAWRASHQPVEDARAAIDASTYPVGECDPLLDLAARDLARLALEQAHQLHAIAEEIIERLPERDRPQLRLTTTEEE